VPHAQEKAKEVNWGRQKNSVARAVRGSRARSVVAEEKRFLGGCSCFRRNMKESALQMNFVINCIHLLLYCSSSREKKKKICRSCCVANLFKVMFMDHFFKISLPC